MEFHIQQSFLSKALQTVIGAVDRRQTLPILSHILVHAETEQLTFFATDMEIELKSYVAAFELITPGKATLPARKLMDICRTLPEEASIKISLSDNQLIVTANSSRFMLGTLSVDDFPSLEQSEPLNEFNLKKEILLPLLEKTHFAMGQQDVRYYLNGLMFIISAGCLETIATNGHRLAMSSIAIDGIWSDPKEHKFIIPRKGVLELMHLLNNVEEQVLFTVCSHHVSINSEYFSFSTRLIEGQFPDFKRVIPKKGENSFQVDRDEIKNIFTRVSVLSHEKVYGVKLNLEKNKLSVKATNPEQEIAEEAIAIEYEGDDLEIGLNARYILDVLSILPSGLTRWILHDANSGIIIESLEDPNSLFVIMPMRL